MPSIHWSSIVPSAVRPNPIDTGIGPYVPKKGLWVGDRRARAAFIGNQMVYPASDLFDSSWRYFTASSPGDQQQRAIPFWVESIDVVLLGGGGAGGAGSTAAVNQPGGGGGAGEWKTATLIAGEDFIPILSSWRVTIDSRVTPGVASGATPTDTNDGKVVIFETLGVGVGDATFFMAAAGGKADAGRGVTRNGYSPGNFEFMGETFEGGVTPPATAGQLGNAGVAPGAGGGGGAAGVNAVRGGGAGSSGAVWFRFVPFTIERAGAR